MAFSKIRFGQGRIFTTIVEDEDGRELSKFKTMERDYVKTLKIIIRQFGLKFKILDKSEDRDLDWAR